MGLEIRNKAGKRFQLADIEDVDDLIQLEMLDGSRRHGAYRSAHEVYAVLLEELEEYWETVKRDKPDVYELIQLCAVTRRAILESAGIDLNEKTEGTKDIHKIQVEPSSLNGEGMVFRLDGGNRGGIVEWNQVPRGIITQIEEGETEFRVKLTQKGMEWL
jgi:hypothetical protein